MKLHVVGVGKVSRESGVGAAHDVSACVPGAGDAWQRCADGTAAPCVLQAASCCVVVSQLAFIALRGFVVRIAAWSQ